MRANNAAGNLGRWVGLTAVAGLLFVRLSFAAETKATVRPVTPNATPEATALLQFLHDISGKHTLSGQHNYPAEKDGEYRAAGAAWGKTPVVFGKDWGFAKAGDKDSAFVRDEIVQELAQQYERGALVTLCWHAVPPTADEPVTFKRPDGSKAPVNLDTVQGRLTDAQWKELLTPGTPLHEHWCAQVDALVPYFKKLEARHVPVLWRPYHEMNGMWFWWGGRRGENGTAALYKMLFERLVKLHQIKNLVWIWNVDRPEGTSLKFNECWPGAEYVDVVALDCYQEFKQSYYNDLLKLANGKPLALSEVGGNLTVQVLKAQPRWTWWMAWAGFATSGKPTNEYSAIVQAPGSWSLSDAEYRKAIAPVRVASGLAAEPATVSRNP